jgi:hypothetical protein
MVPAFPTAQPSFALTKAIPFKFSVVDAVGAVAPTEPVWATSRRTQAMNETGKARIFLSQTQYGQFPYLGFSSFAPIINAALRERVRQNEFANNPLTMPRLLFRHPV